MSINREHLENMRWLYDSDESYKKAIRQIMAEEVKEKRRALLKKKIRQARMQKRIRTVTKPFMGLAAQFKLSGPGGIGHQAARLARRSAVVSRQLVATRQRMAISGAVILGVLVIGTFAISLGVTRKPPSEQGGVDGQGATGMAGATSSAADAPFDPIILSDTAAKPEDYRYDSSKELLTYSATISGIKATISQQPFPQDFIQDTAKFEQFLEGIPNKQTLPLVSGTAYLSVIKADAAETDPIAAVTGAGGKVQYAVYMNPKFLVFVRAESPLPKEDWQVYFKSLTLN